MVKQIVGSALVVAPARDERLCSPLSDLGVNCYRAPLFRIEYASKQEVLAPQTDALSIFTSSHAVRAVGALYSLKNLPCAAVGRGTAQSLEQLGAEVLVCPRKSGIAQLAPAIVDYFNSGPQLSRAVFYRGEVVKEGLVESLRAALLTISESVVYRLRACDMQHSEDLQRVVEFLSSAPSDRSYRCAVITSQQILTIYSKFLASQGLHEKASKIPLMLFSPRLVETAREAGLPVGYVHDSSTFASFVEGIVRWMKGECSLPE